MTPERLAEIRCKLETEQDRPFHSYRIHGLTKVGRELLTYISDLQTMAAADHETIQKLQMTIAVHVRENQDLRERFKLSYAHTLYEKLERLESENKLLRAVAEAAEKERQKMIDIWPEPLDSEDTEELGEALKAWKEGTK